MVETFITEVPGGGSSEGDSLTSGPTVCLVLCRGLVGLHPVGRREAKCTVVSKEQSLLWHLRLESFVSRVAKRCLHLRR